MRTLFMVCAGLIFSGLPSFASINQVVPGFEVVLRDFDNRIINLPQGHRFIAIYSYEKGSPGVRNDGFPWPEYKWQNEIHSLVEMDHNNRFQALRVDLRDRGTTKFRNLRVQLRYEVQRPAGTENCRLDFNRYYVAIFSDASGARLPFSTEISYFSDTLKAIPSPFQIRIVGHGYDSNWKGIEVPLQEGLERYRQDCRQYEQSSVSR